MHRIRLIILATFFILLFGEIWLGFPINLDLHGEDPALLNSSLSSSNAAKHMEGVHYVESRSGDRDWELFAESADGSDNAGEWDLKNVRVLFYSDDKVEFTVTGKTGKIDNKTKDMRIAGNVLTQSRNGYRFQTEAVNYQSTTRQIKSLDRVKMSGPPDENGKGINVAGDWMEALVDQNLMTIHNDVDAKKIMSNGKLLTVKSNIAEFSGKSRTVRFLDKVAVEMDSMKMEGPEAQFQYQGVKDILSSVLVNGGVKVSDLDKYATSESISFDPEKNRFTLKGKPRVVQNNDEITGDQIVFIDGGKKVKVENMKAHMEKLQD